MREILFRGKAITTDRFVEGAYYHQMEFYGDECNEHYIISSKDVLEDNMTCCDEVFPESVSEFTGLTDKNGKKIFENGYFVIDEQTYKVVFDNAQYILTNIFSCDIILLKDNSNKGVFIDEI